MSTSHLPLRSERIREIPITATLQPELSTLLRCHQLRTQHPFSVLGSHTALSCHVSLVSCSLGQVLSLSLPSMTLRVLKCSGQLFRRLSPHVACVTRMVVRVLGRNVTEMLSGPSQCLLSTRSLSSFVFYGWGWPCSLKGVSVGFLHCQVTVFPYVVNKHIVGNIAEAMQIPEQGL